MPYDPTLPQTNDPIGAAAMRSQLNGLKALIDAVPPAPAVPVMVIANGGAFSQVLDVARPLVFVVDAGAGSSLLFFDNGSADGVWQIVNYSPNDVNVAASSGSGSIGTVAAGAQGRLVVSGGVGTLT
jgi:hypothetical protein